MQFITFSRKLGTNGARIAKRVSEQMGYAFHSTETIETMARGMGFNDDISNVNDKPSSGFRRFLPSKPKIQLDRLSLAIYELANKGNAVFLGRGSYIFLRSYQCALHVRVTASMEKRIQNLIQRGFPHETVPEMIKKSDNERSGYIKLFFNSDWDNPEMYDIVLNMDNISEDFAADTVIHMARSEKIKGRLNEVTQALEKMCLLQRVSGVHAALMEAETFDPMSSNTEVSVLEPGCVQLTGVANDQATKDVIEKAIQEVKGVQKIDNKIIVVKYK
ncbi:MAG: cytidylate kinase family protein [Spirochaetales bacterium]|nr:cytidylate kinase family protein [Spirochaetales bacterium]